MNNKKLSFISCVNNFEEYNTALRYINNLRVPYGYEIETIAIEKANSLTSGYNEAMNKSDAKYKVYLHQDTYILNVNFIYEIIRLFEVYPKLGMLGVIGSKTLPKGIWWQSLNLYGTVYHTLAGKGNIDLMSYSSVRNDYEKILAIDGLIMMTQYDLEWREDIFQGWHFYDISQCLEFIKAGYEVGVPKQRGPWCLHDTGITNDSGYEKDRKIFIEKYKDFIL